MTIMFSLLLMHRMVYTHKIFQYVTIWFQQMYLQRIRDVGYNICWHYIFEILIWLCYMKCVNVWNVLDMGYIHMSTKNKKAWIKCHRIAEDIFKWVFLTENICIVVEMSLKFVLKGPAVKSARFQVMMCRLTGDTPLSAPILTKVPLDTWRHGKWWVNMRLYIKNI